MVNARIRVVQQFTEVIAIRVPFEKIFPSRTAADLQY